MTKDRTEILASREVALQKRAIKHQYAGRSSGELAEIAAQLCVSAARLKRFDTLSSHLNEILAQGGRVVFQ